MTKQIESGPGQQMPNNHLNSWTGSATEYTCQGCLYRDLGQKYIFSCNLDLLFFCED